MYIPEPKLEPNDPITVGRCKWCEEDIYAGEEIIVFGEDSYHFDCFTDCAASILRKEYGARLCVAEPWDGYEG